MASRNQRKNRRKNRQQGNQNRNQRNEDRTRDEDVTSGVMLNRSSSETKASFKSTELLAYVGAVLAVIMTALAIDEDGQGGTDPFGAEQAIRYITFLTIGYVIARGLAKSGSQENYWGGDTDFTDVDTDIDADADSTRTPETHHVDARNDEADTETVVTDADSAPSRETAEPEPGHPQTDARP